MDSEYIMNNTLGRNEGDWAIKISLIQGYLISRMGQLELRDIEREIDKDHNDIVRYIRCKIFEKNTGKKIGHICGGAHSYTFSVVIDDLPRVRLPRDSQVGWSLELEGVNGSFLKTFFGEG